MCGGGSSSADQTQTNETVKLADPQLTLIEVSVCCVPGNEYPNTEAVEIDAATFVFGAPHKGYYKAVAVDANGAFKECRYFDSSSLGPEPDRWPARVKRYWASANKIAGEYYSVQVVQDEEDEDDCEHILRPLRYVPRYPQLLRSDPVSAGGAGAGVGPVVSVAWHGMETQPALSGTAVSFVVRSVRLLSKAMLLQCEQGPAIRQFCRANGKRFRDKHFGPVLNPGTAGIASAATARELR